MAVSPFIELAGKVTNPA